MNGDENEFEFEGKTYVAVADDIANCELCAMFMNDDCIAMVGYDVPECYKDFRKDSRSVHFKEKQ